MDLSTHLHINVHISLDASQSKALELRVRHELIWCVRGTNSPIDLRMVSVLDFILATSEFLVKTAGPRTTTLSGVNVVILTSRFRTAGMSRGIRVRWTGAGLVVVVCVVFYDRPITVYDIYLPNQA